MVSCFCNNRNIFKWNKRNSSEIDLQVHIQHIPHRCKGNAVGNTLILLTNDAWWNKVWLHLLMFDSWQLQASLLPLLHMPHILGRMIRLSSSFGANLKLKPRKRILTWCTHPNYYKKFKPRYFLKSLTPFSNQCGKLDLFSPEISIKWVTNLIIISLWVYVPSSAFLSEPKFLWGPMLVLCGGYYTGMFGYSHENIKLNLYLTLYTKRQLRKTLEHRNFY